MVDLKSQSSQFHTDDTNDDVFGAQECCKRIENIPFGLNLSV